MDVAPWNPERKARARACAEPPAERLRDALSLFDLVSQLMRAGIRHQFPGADGQRVEQIFRERLRLARKLENRT